MSISSWHASWWIAPCSVKSVRTVSSYVDTMLCISRTHWRIWARLVPQPPVAWKPLPNPAYSSAETKHYFGTTQTSSKVSVLLTTAITGRGTEPLIMGAIPKSNQTVTLSWRIKGLPNFMNTAIHNFLTIPAKKETNRYTEWQNTATNLTTACSAYTKTTHEVKNY